ncbi:hypothetical protein BCEN4_40037 [Burkholderia cenocepacia]|nr:hypothetical protein BCEN4_40037 [Burkholderia cenocepacia]
MPPQGRAAHSFKDFKTWNLCEILAYSVLAWHTASFATVLGYRNKRGDRRGPKPAGLVGIQKIFSVPQSIHDIDVSVVGAAATRGRTRHASLICPTSSI